MPGRRPPPPPPIIPVLHVACIPPLVTRFWGEAPFGRSPAFGCRLSPSRAAGRDAKYGGARHHATRPRPRHSMELLSCHAIPYTARLTDGRAALPRRQADPFVTGPNHHERGLLQDLPSWGHATSHPPCANQSRGGGMDCQLNCSYSILSHGFGHAKACCLVASRTSVAP